MKLIDAYNLLFSLTKSKDNARSFKETYEHFSKGDDDALDTYLLFVSDNCVEWLERLPDKYASQEALSKPKTGILKLIEQPSVVEYLGEDTCKRLKQVITDTWKLNKDRIAAERTEGLQQDIESPPLDQEIDAQSFEADNPHVSPHIQSTDMSALQAENVRLAEQCQTYKEAIFHLLEACCPDQKEVWKVLRDTFLS